MNRKCGVIGTETVQETLPKRPDVKDLLGIDTHFSNEENGTKDRVRSCVRARGKLSNVREAIGITREARTLFGGNGVTLDYPPMRHMSNLEIVRTYEGTDEIHTLILGNAFIGISVFR